MVAGLSAPPADRLRILTRPARRPGTAVPSGPGLVLFDPSPDGAPGPTAMVIQPAAGSDMAPIIAEAYGLSARELEITQLVARGLSTGDIAAELVISPHTVRDHLKTVFAKTRVSSRGELVARLFAENHRPRRNAP